MQRMRSLVLPMGLLLATAAGAEPQCLDDADVCLAVERGAGEVRFVASNRTAAPYTFRVSVARLRNLRALSALPFRGVVEPGATQRLGVLVRVDPARDTDFESRWGAALGSALARHDDRWRYRMPFAGTRAQVSQGVGGRFSHTGPAVQSLDFAMPFGTPVLAARPGRVVAVRDGHAASGTRRMFYDKANTVEVLHADGTLAAYAHLRDGVEVAVGEEVETGQRIGYSGDTGFATGPHLHFMVWRRLADLSWASVPVRFFDGTREGFVPTRGIAYAPGCTGPGCEGDEDAAESVPAAPAGAARPAVRREDGACVCGNGAVIHVELPCSQVCGG